MNHSQPESKRGSVVLVALCCVAVLGIGLASYLAVSSQAMKLSNRSFQSSISGQLAETGLEEALRTLNNNSWVDWHAGTTPTRTDGTWSVSNRSVSAANAATGVIVFPVGKFGQGLGAEVNLLIPKVYKDGAIWRAGRPWSNEDLYRRNDMVFHQGVWFQCKLDSASGPPVDNANWVSTPNLWNPSATYRANSIVVFGGFAFRCLLAQQSNESPDGSGWSRLAVLEPWRSTPNYAVDDVVTYAGVFYRCIQPNSGKLPFDNPLDWASAPVIYSEGIVTLPDGTPSIKTQIVAYFSPSSLFPNALAASRSVLLPAGGIVDSYNFSVGPYSTTALSNISSLAGIAAGKTSLPAVTISGARINGYVSAPPAPLEPHAPLIYFGPSAIVTGIKPADAPAMKLDLSRVSRSPFIPQVEVKKWNATTNYLIGDIVLSSGQWYRCKQPHSNVAPPGLTWDHGDNITLDDDYSSGEKLLTARVYSKNTGLRLIAADHIIKISNHVVIAVNGDLEITAGKIIVAENSSAEIHFSGRLMIGNEGGGITIEGTNPDPKKLLLIQSASPALAANYIRQRDNFHGVVYIPYSTLNIDDDDDPSPATDVTIYGAISAKEIIFQNDANVHYDTSLRTATFRSLDTPFMITEWRELTDPAERIVFP